MKANDSTNSSAVIVALPADDDPVHALGPEPSHVTLCYLGDAADSDAPTLSKAVGDVAATHKPFTEAVSGKGTLGADNAHVLTFDGADLTQLRESLLQHPDIAGPHGATEQFPNFVPHMTLGYPDENDSLDQLPQPPNVHFDKVALWHGDTKTDHPLGGASMTASISATDAPLSSSDFVPGMIPWHGVWAVEGKPSGDNRTFGMNSLDNRPLPLPLTWQKAAQPAHAGEVKVGGATQLARVRNPQTDLIEIRAAGWMLQNAEADEVVGEMAAFGRVGCSVGVDSATFEIDPTGAGPFGGAVNFTQARITNCTMVITGALEDAWISLGEAPEGFLGDSAQEADGATDFAVSSKPWDGSAGRFTPEQWKRSCILHITDGPEKSNHKLPIREPDGSLSRAGVHAAAARLNQVQAPDSAKASAKRALSAAYSELGETAPDVLTSSDSPDRIGHLDTYTTMQVLDEDGALLEFGRGPGWVTNPKATSRIHAYWTEPGQPGYAKIAWGTDGDFNRCRAQVGEEIGENSPSKTRYLNQICAQWHKDALGYYPSTHAKMDRAGKHSGLAPLVASVSMVASAGASWMPKLEWFSNPNLTEPTLIQFEDHPEGTRVYGHLAEWGRCHLDFPGACVTPPNLDDGGANFMIHRIITDSGIISGGHITFGGGHADGYLGITAARSHYDDASTVFCDVVVGADDIGIWFSGWLRPDHNNEADRFKLFAAQTSGDWREVGADGLCLIAAHSVVSPGFGIKPQVHIENARTTALVAAGGLPGRAQEPGAGASAPASTMQEAVAAGIDLYEQRKQARARLEAAANAVGATPEARLARVRAEIEE